MALGKAFTDFFAELELNNYREWFNDNKKRFISDVKEPFEELTADVISKMKKVDPEIAVEPKDCVFRIYRDTRFSKDKTPYKTHMAAVVGRGGRRDHEWPGIYFQVNAHGISIAGGCWKPSKERLYRIREKIAEDPKAFRKIVDAKKFRETFGEIGDEKNKIIPKEFREAAEKAPEIFNKSFHYWRSYNGKKYVTDAQLAKNIVDHYKLAGKFNSFLIETL